MEASGTKGFIVITSIFDPTEAISLFAGFKQYNLVVVGDKKTPAGWKHHNVEFLDIRQHKRIGKSLNKVLPKNHYCRKMIGYLYAIERRAPFIIDTDDDNLPKENWAFPEMEANHFLVPGELGFINVYQLFTKSKIWPRGLPLNLIGKQYDLEPGIEQRPCKVGIWQGLADDDPDVDAIYRLTNNTPCYFDKREPIVLGNNTISPFNSQNTFITNKLFALLYLPAYVTFRFTDILRGLVAQPIMWLHGYSLGFTDATVIQKRNVHNFYKDFLSEIPVYRYSEDIIEITRSAIHSKYSIDENLMNAYEALYKKGIVKKIELAVLNEWLKELQLLK